MLRDDTDKAWQAIGASEPYFGVVSGDMFRVENLGPEERERFFRSGELHADRVLRHAVEFFGDSLRYDAALDFGCGVGRVSIPLAQRFKRVLAVDISEAMMAEASSNASERGIGNIEFVESDDTLSRIQGPVDFVHSFIVLQHVPTSRGERLIAALVEALREGGVGAIDVSLHRRVPRWRRVLGWAKTRVVALHYLHNMLRGRPWNEPLMQTNLYSLNALASLFLEHGITELHITLARKESDAPHDKAMIYFRKPAGDSEERYP